MDDAAVAKETGGPGGNFLTTITPCVSRHRSFSFNQVVTNEYIPQWDNAGDIDIRRHIIKPEAERLQLWNLLKWNRITNTSQPSIMEVCLQSAA